MLGWSWTIYSVELADIVDCFITTSSFYTSDKLKVLQMIENLQPDVLNRPGAKMHLNTLTKQYIGLIILVQKMCVNSLHHNEPVLLYNLYKYVKVHPHDCLNAEYLHSKQRKGYTNLSIVGKLYLLDTICSLVNEMSGIHWLDFWSHNSLAMSMILASGSKYLINPPVVYNINFKFCMLL